MSFDGKTVTVGAWRKSDTLDQASGTQYTISVGQSATFSIPAIFGSVVCTLESNRVSIRNSSEVTFYGGSPLSSYCISIADTTNSIESMIDLSPTISSTGGFSGVSQSAIIARENSTLVKPAGITFPAVDNGFIYVTYTFGIQHFWTDFMNTLEV